MIVRFLDWSTSHATTYILLFGVNFAITVHGFATGSVGWPLIHGGLSIMMARRAIELSKRPQDHEEI